MTDINEINKDKANEIIKTTAKECIEILLTEKTIRHCAYTTHDLSVVGCVTERAVKAIKEKYKI